VKLEINNLNCGYAGKNIVRDISFAMETGEILCILGPNGVGKTTLFKTILGFLPRQQGEVLLDGTDVGSWPRKKLAKMMAYVPQAHNMPFPFSVMDVVVMGRTAHLDTLASPGKKDYKIAEETIESLEMGYLKDSSYTEISGGERQMVLIARALAQQPKILVMDEPTSNLDFGNQTRVLNQINKLKERDIGIIMTSHFPDHAFLCSSKVVLMQKGKIYHIGDSKDTVTEENLRKTYGIEVKITSVKNTAGHEVKTCVAMIN